MFRELARKNLQLSNEECIEVLKNETRGVLSVIGDDGYPYGMPMNHVYSDADGAIYFHCGREGHRLDALKKCNKVSYCTYDRGFREDGEWAWKVKSVIVFGKMEIIDDSEIMSKVITDLCLKFAQSEEYSKAEIAQYGHLTLTMKLTPEHMCGKLVTES